MKKIIALSIAALVLTAFICGCASDKPTQGAASNGNYSDEMKISAKVDLDPEAGADSVERDGDHKDSLYFASADYYNMKSNDTLTILPKFKTYQQTSESSCGVVSALTVLNYFGKLGDYTEESLAKLRNESCDYQTSGATALQQMISIFDHVGGFKVNSTYDYYGKADENGSAYFGEDGSAEAAYSVITLEWIRDQLKAGTPIMICWNDWGGHWQVIIGYDTMGSDSTQHDVIIVADPYDTTDHNQDGYGVYGAERFYYNWSMYDFFEGSEFAVERDLLFVIVTPEK